MMKKNSYINFGIQSLFFIFLHIIHSQQLCPPPDVPRYGDYFPRQNIFQPGDKVTYNCTEMYTLMGRESSKCKSNGDWSNPIPFCDLKAEIKSPYTTNIRGQHIYIPQITDGNTSTCTTFITGESITMTLDMPASLHAVRLFLKRGDVNIEVVNGFKTCGGYSKHIDTSQWVSLQCNKNLTASNTVKLQDKSRKNNNSTICEIEVYVKEDESCDDPPDKKVANGYFVVTRTLAKLMCEDGYRRDSDNDRLVCEKNFWMGSRLECKEILCTSEIDVPVAPGSEWLFLDSVSKISAGTRQQLKCRDGYEKIGSSDIIVCQKSGVWTTTNATCIEIAKAKTSTKTIIIAVVGTAVMLIIISLFATTIYFVRKQRREVVVVYKSPVEGSIISGSEAEYASAYYESIQSTAPQPPASSRPTAQMISDVYFTPLDSQDSLKKQPMPVDIAFGTLKQSTLYR